MRYDIYGKDVLLANKMESNGERGKILISSPLKQILSEHFPNLFEFKPGPDVSVKSINIEMKSFFVTQPSEWFRGIETKINSASSLTLVPNNFKNLFFNLQRKHESFLKRMEETRERCFFWLNKHINSGISSDKWIYSSLFRLVCKFLLFLSVCCFRIGRIIVSDGELLGLTNKFLNAQLYFELAGSWLSWLFFSCNLFFFLGIVQFFTLHYS